VGLMDNPQLPFTELCVFVHATVDDGLTADATTAAAALPAVGGQARRVGRPDANKAFAAPRGGGGRAAAAGGASAASVAAAARSPPNYHLVMQFALQLLHMALKRKAGANGLAAEGVMLAPLVALLSRGLESRRVPVVTAALKSLCLLIPLREANVAQEADALCTRVFSMMSGVKTSSPLVQDGFKLVAALIRACPSYQMPDDNLKYLLETAFVDLEDQNNRSTTFSLLKAITSRKVLLPQVYDLMVVVAKHMVRSQQPTVRQLCAQVFLGFLLDYPLGHKRLSQHLDFVVRNLAYEHASGREAVLSLLTAVVAKFPQPVLEEHADGFFLPLVTRLVNETDARCRAACGRLLCDLLTQVRVP
jgi:U3 small nucleolar RNA-associated protein 20